MMAVFKNFIVSVVVAGCAQTHPHEDGSNNALLSSLIGTTWLADVLMAPGAQPQASPQLHFSSATHVSGHGGCNAFGGNLAVSGATVRLGPVAATRKLCIESVMMSESHFFQALHRVNSLRLDGGETLMLLDEKGAVALRLTRR